MADEKVKAKIVEEPPDPAVAKVLERHKQRRVLPTPMSTEDYIQLASKVAQQEITKVASALALEVENGVRKSMDPLSQKISELYHKVNEIDIHIHAMIELLVERSIFTRDDFRARVQQVTQALIAKHEAQAAQAAQRAAALKATAEKPDGPEAPEAE